MRTNIAPAEALDNAAGLLNQAKEVASHTLDEGKVKARKLMKQSERFVEEASDETVHCIKRHPVSSVAVSFAAGLAIGVIVPKLIRR